MSKYEMVSIHKMQFKNIKASTTKKSKILSYSRRLSGCRGFNHINFPKLEVLNKYDKRASFKGGEETVKRLTYKRLSYYSTENLKSYTHPTLGEVKFDYSTALVVKDNRFVTPRSYDIYHDSNRVIRYCCRSDGSTCAVFSEKGGYSKKLKKLKDFKTVKTDNPRALEQLIAQLADKYKVGDFLET